MVFDSALTSVATGETPDSGFALLRNFPNPFNPVTTIVFSLPSGAGDGTLSLRIYDVLGRDIETLFDGRGSPGIQSVTWDASRFPGGVYFCIARAGGVVAMRKLVLIR
jgi:hypothetical protein